MFIKAKIHFLSTHHAVCRELFVKIIGDEYYPDGPVFLCFEGFLQFVSSSTWTSDIIPNTAVTCSTMFNNIDTLEEEGIIVDTTTCMYI